MHDTAEHHTSGDVDDILEALARHHDHDHREDGGRFAHSPMDLHLPDARIEESAAVGGGPTEGGSAGQIAGQIAGQTVEDSTTHHGVSISSAGAPPPPEQRGSVPLPPGGNTEAAPADSLLVPRAPAPEQPKLRTDPSFAATTTPLTQSSSNETSEETRRYEETRRLEETRRPPQPAQQNPQQSPQSSPVNVPKRVSTFERMEEGVPGEQRTPVITEFKERQGMVYRKDPSPAPPGAVGVSAGAPPPRNVGPPPKRVAKKSAAAVEGAETHHPSMEVQGRGRVLSPSQEESGQQQPSGEGDAFPENWERKNGRTDAPVAGNHVAQSHNKNPRGYPQNGGGPRSGGPPPGVLPQNGEPPDGFGMLVPPAARQPPARPQPQAKPSRPQSLHEQDSSSFKTPINSRQPSPILVGRDLGEHAPVASTENLAGENPANANGVGSNGVGTEPIGGGPDVDNLDFSEEAKNAQAWQEYYRQIEAWNKAYGGEAGTGRKIICFVIVLRDCVMLFQKTGDNTQKGQQLPRISCS